MVAKKTLQPLYDLKAPFIDSLDAYTGAAEALAAAVSSALTLDSGLNPRVAVILREQLEKFRRCGVGE